MARMLSADTESGAALRRLCNWHRPGAAPSVAVFSTPRSGSTWLMELIRTQPGFKAIEEPLNLRNRPVREALGLHSWDALFADDADEILHDYFLGFLDGDLRFMDHHPLAAHHRWRTNRVVFKILHGAEHHSGVLTRLGVEPLHLIRHPIPVARSRRQLPRLAAQLSADSLRRHPPEVAALAIGVAERGTPLQRAVLAWSLHNAALLRAGIRLVTYEQLVIDPEPVVALLAAEFSLPEPDRMLANLHRRSHSHPPADEDRAVALEGADRTDRLVNDWIGKVSPADARSALDVALGVGVDIYRFDGGLPHPRYLVTAPQEEASTA